LLVKLVNVLGGLAVGHGWVLGKGEGKSVIGNR
jgi:hypothetical protein